MHVYLVYIYSCSLYPYTLIPLYTYTLTPLYPYTLIPSYPYTLIPLYPYTLIPLYPYTPIHLGLNKGVCVIYTSGQGVFSPKANNNYNSNNIHSQSQSQSQSHSHTDLNRLDEYREIHQIRSLLQDTKGRV